MDISLNWLNRYVKVDDISAEELASKVTSVGLEVEVPTGTLLLSGLCVFSTFHRS